MGDIMGIVESEGKRKALAHSDLSSDSKKRARVERRDEEEQIPSIFLCHSTGASPADSQGPSDSAQNEERESCLELHKTKHKIFLSHAGTEKSFVEQLCVDLEAKGYSFPFFDQSSHSLPKGRDFAPLILEAAKQCHVAVLVLSETFLTSKWPMIELGAFYEAKKGGNPGLNLLPLFFKLSMEDLDDRSIAERWMPKWREYASVDGKIDVNQWREAVKALPKVNGFVFEQAKARHKESTGILYRSEVAYRSAVTEAIFELSPPDLLYGACESMVGYDRLCQTLSSQFVEDPVTGVLLLGLYGMPGLGKTTMSKALCDHFHSELVGRVCRVELGDSSTTPLVRQKEVLKQLLGIKNGVLDTISHIDQGRTLMRDCLKRDCMKRQCAVFLAIDNVTGDQDSVDEARAYLEAGFHPKSKIMVTSRGQKIVKELLSDSKFCKRVPELTEEEAGAIFMKIAGPGMILCVEERENVGLFVNQCRFSRYGTFDSGEQYHPLALRALANYCRNQDTKKKSWSVCEKYLEDFNQGSSADLFDILELQLKSLDQTKQLFLDIAVYGEDWLKSLGGTQNLEYEDWIQWLAGMHMDSPAAYVERNLRELERSGMIELRNVTMHQLYKAFAVWFVSKGNSWKNEWCVRGSAACYERTRIRIVGLKGGISRSRVEREWGSLELLQLHSCPRIRELNLEGLDCLRHLELVELKNLETLTLSTENDSLRFVWMSGLDSLKNLPEFRSSCIFLQAILITRCLNLTEPLRIEGCSELKTLRADLHLCPEIDINFTTALRSLLEVHLSNCGGGGSGEGDVLNLEGLVLCHQLKVVTLADLLVKRVVGLAQLTSILWLVLWGCSCLEEAPEINPVTTVGFRDLENGLGSNIWPREFRDCSAELATDIVRKLLELEEEAVSGGLCGGPKSSFRLKLDDSLGPTSLSSDLIHYLMDLYDAEEYEELGRLLPGLLRILDRLNDITFGGFVVGAVYAIIGL